MTTSSSDRDLLAELDRLEGRSFCYVTTRGRRTGRDHTIEIWFGRAERTIYLLSGGGDRSDWVRNMRADPAVRVRIADSSLSGTARMVMNEDEDGTARRLLAAKYQGWREGAELSNWARTALVVAVDLDPPGTGSSP